MNRRKFIGTLGLSMALPGLECFGNVKRDVKRFAAVYVPNGINMHHWTPNGYGDRDLLINSLISFDEGSLILSNIIIVTSLSEI